MELRPYLTAGAAIVSTGALVAALPAIVPSPTPPDVAVSVAAPQSVYADVALRQSTQDLFNAIFSGFPDTNGPRGLVGVASLLTENNALANAFVTGGIVGLASELAADNTLLQSFIDGGIVAVAGDLTAANPILNAFFVGVSEDGPTGIVGVADLLTQSNPLANAFVTGGIVGVADLLTQDNALANAFVTGGIVGLASQLVPDGTLAQTFLDGGFVAVTEEVLVNATAGDEVVQQGIQSFFSGYPPAGPDDDPPIGPAGVVGLTHFILDALTGGIQTPPAEDGQGTLTVEQLSVPESGATLLAASTGPADTQDLPEANEPVNPSARTFNLNVGTQLRTAAVDPVEIDQKVVEPDPDETVTAAAATGAAPAAQPAPAPVPAPVPAPAPAVDPAPVSNEDDADDSKKVTEDELKSGNKVEVDPILLENGTGGGGGTAWDETIKRWQDFGAKLGFGGGAAPAAPSTPDTGGTDGAS